MKILRKVILYIPAILVIFGCSTIDNPFPPSKSIVNDVSVRKTENSGYNIVKVDGNPVERAHSQFVSVVPMVLVEPGEHVLTLEASAGENLSPTKLNISVEAGKKYKLVRQGKNILIVEDPN